MAGENLVFLQFMTKLDIGALLDATNNKINLLNKGGMLCLVEMEQARQDWAL